MSPVVDSFRKVTVSLGGRCPLNCRHCYTTVSAFTTAPRLSVEEVVDSLVPLDDLFDIICVSGDTDCFLDEREGLSLIATLVRIFPEAHLMFTTRIVPGDDVVDELGRLAADMAERHRLMLPGVSLVSPDFPNFSEKSHLIASTDARIELLSTFTELGMATLFALRPTFPFALVSADQVRQLLTRAAPRCAAVLGEVMILDSAGQLAGRLGIPTRIHSDRLSPMTFLDQDALWSKRSYPREARFAADVCEDLRVPYFLRSGSALRYIEANWSWESGRILDGALQSKSWLGEDVLTSPDP
jgi:hypothetical protein